MRWNRSAFENVDLGTRHKERHADPIVASINRIAYKVVYTT